MLLTSMAGIAEFEATLQGILFWLALGLGPILLVAGPILTLARPARKIGAGLVLAGAAVLTCFAIYFAAGVPTSQPSGGLDLRRVLIAASVVAVALASDLAAYKMWTLHTNSSSRRDA